ncbi:PAQR family membrane homeostasis protein TrhA [Acutalibacter caecimuris]|uniref:PAQR family membrane homeostasis protein TrhA n=1 Tax=Acutalibacter caecimuris TaxID=3093657 RepID=UPI002AC8DA04|nr:hemolysin III family protein [Acutalibacter sp. M00118]
MENTVKIKNLCKAEARRDRCAAMGLPRYSLGEEIFSSVSHGVSALLAVGALVLLLVFCDHTPLTVSAVSIYGSTMGLLYTISAIYHGLGLNRAKKVFRSLDHCTIFLLIAGTYTPITLVGMGGAGGWAMFGVVWAAAVVGVILNAVSVERFKVFSMACYLCMGWVVVLGMRTLRQNISETGFWCLLLGGVLYTIGAVLYGLGKKLPYMHAVFHLFVLAGSVLHTVCIYQVVK